MNIHLSPERWDRIYSEIMSGTWQLPEDPAAALSLIEMASDRRFKESTDHLYERHIAQVVPVKIKGLIFFVTFWAASVFWGSRVISPDRLPSFFGICLLLLAVASAGLFYVEVSLQKSFVKKLIEASRDTIPEDYLTVIPQLKAEIQEEAED